MSNFALFILYCGGVAILAILILFSPFLIYEKYRQYKCNKLFNQITQFAIEYKYSGSNHLIAIDKSFTNICFIDLKKVAEQNKEESGFYYLKAEHILSKNIFADYVNIDLQLITTDERIPVLMINFFKSDYAGRAKLERVYQIRLKEVRTWDGYFQIMMNKKELE